MARDLGPGKTIVTVLCDSGQRYASKVYDAAFLTARGLPTPQWLNR
jgi:cysteine synthase A